ncbi:MAG: hypothetical protein OEU90_03275 [Gammaproteobacteria bacterium]|jgi:hypothetical protein|nr:hypothetical protein [Gammaproteobacteria bacterium]MDH3750914.1 hypothetical protein [Gammaproteobacteria bacterium]MDH3804474.1 hypothetical protein [Gammaproteobacteria bacterium]
MFKAIRISVLLFILFFVALNTWLSQARSTDWNNSLWVKIYPINADGSDASTDYILGLESDDFAGIEQFIARETERYGKSVSRPLRMELGRPINEQPPTIEPGASGLDIMLWSLKLRWWSSNTAGKQDSVDPDVRMFVRYHSPDHTLVLENSVGMQKGMVGIVNAYGSRRHTGSNNVVIAHEFLHTLGATDKYDPANGQPLAPDGLAEPDRKPLYPQRYAEIMGGRIARAEDDAVIPKNLKWVTIGPKTASEIRLID